MKIGYKNNTLCYWWREKNHKVLMCFLGVLCVFFGCLEERKMCRETRQRAENLEKCLPPLVWRVLGAIYSLSMRFEAAALQGPLDSIGLKMGWSWHPWKYFDFLFPKRYGSWKSNSQIKSYSSRKLAVHRSICQPCFHDISVVLTLI